MLDELWLKKYDQKLYNCSHFCRDAWLMLTGADISDMVGAWNSGSLAEAMRSREDLRRLESPGDRCIVMCQKPGKPPHVGVYVEGRVFHMTPDGPKMHDLSFIKSSYNSVKYYYVD